MADAQYGRLVTDTARYDDVAGDTFDAAFPGCPAVSVVASDLSPVPDDARTATIPDEVATFLSSE
jgi:hypothetical protein